MACHGRVFSFWTACCASMSGGLVVLAGRQLEIRRTLMTSQLACFRCLFLSCLQQKSPQKTGQLWRPSYFLTTLEKNYINGNCIGGNCISGGLHVITKDRKNWKTKIDRKSIPSAQWKIWPHLVLHLYAWENGSSQNLVGKMNKFINWTENLPYRFCTD
jgi:hypothetical protein